MKNESKNQSHFEREIERRLNSPQWDMEMSARILERQRGKVRRRLSFAAASIVAVLLIASAFALPRLLAMGREKSVASKAVAKKDLTVPSAKTPLVAMGKSPVVAPDDAVAQELVLEDPFGKGGHDFQDLDEFVDGVLERR